MPRIPPRANRCVWGPLRWRWSSMGLGSVIGNSIWCPSSLRTNRWRTLLGPGITAADLNDDCLGRTLDWLYTHDVTTLFAGLAWRARRAFAVPLTRLHADTTSFAVSGDYAPGKAIWTRRRLR